MSAAARRMARWISHIAHAAAEIAVHVCDEFGLGGIGVLGEQRGRLHDLPGLAVATLRNLLGDPGALQRVLALGIQTFDGGDLFARGLRHGGLAGAHRLTVEVDSTGATQAGAATEFRAGHLQMLADDPQQGRVIRYVDRMVMPIDIQGDHTPSKGGFLKSRTAASRFRDVAGFRLPERCGPPFAATSVGFICYVPTLARCQHLLGAEYCSAKRVPNSTAQNLHASKSLVLSKTNSKLAAAFQPLCSGSTTETRCPALRAGASATTIFRSKLNRYFQINIEQAKSNAPEFGGRCLIPQGSRLRARQSNIPWISSGCDRPARVV